MSPSMPSVLWDAHGVGALGELQGDAGSRTVGPRRVAEGDLWVPSPVGESKGHVLPSPMALRRLKTGVERSFWVHQRLSADGADVLWGSSSSCPVFCSLVALRGWRGSSVTSLE